MAVRNFDESTRQTALASMLEVSRLSTTSTRVTFERATTFASAWGATLIDAGSHGHLGSAARLGMWPRGVLWFGQFLATLKTA